MRPPVPMPSIDRLLHLFDLDTDSGHLIHKKKCGTKRGSIAGSITPHGYFRVKVDGRLYLVHRVIYFMATGEDPGILEVDHIDGNKGNNKPSNLRLATREQNRQNVPAYTSNKFNARGTWFDDRRNAYFCAVQAFGVREQFGPFATLAEASRVYEREARERFGEFYREQKQ